MITGSIQYIDVGIKLEVEPQVYADGDVGIKINLEVSNIGHELFHGNRQDARSPGALGQDHQEL